jgi:hypothetical protein
MRGFAGGSTMRLEFDAKAFVTLETAISAAQTQMTHDKGSSDFQK